MVIVQIKITNFLKTCTCKILSIFCTNQGLEIQIWILKSLVFLFFLNKMWFHVTFPPVPFSSDFSSLITHTQTTHNMASSFVLFWKSFCQDLQKPLNCPISRIQFIWYLLLRFVHCISYFWHYAPCCNCSAFWYTILGL